MINPMRIYLKIILEYFSKLNASASGVARIFIPPEFSFPPGYATVKRKISKY